MITVEDVKYELRIPQTDTSKDAYISKIITQSIEKIRAITKNPKLFLDIESASLDEVLLYFVCQRMNPFTRYGSSAGIQSQTVGGHSITHLEDYPKSIKDVLHQYSRVVNFL